MSDITLTIDGRQVTVPAGQTILDAALANGIDIPHLCYDPRLTPTGACRLCLVEIEGQAGLHTSCTRLAEPGMTVRTESEAVVRSRRSTLEMLLSEHNVSCTTCDADGDCLLQDYAYRYQAAEKRFARLPSAQAEPDTYTAGHKGIVYDPSKCVRCQRCVKICAEVEMAEALTLKGRALDVQVSTAFDLPLNDSTCEICGLCVSACPTGALWERAAVGQGRAKDLVKVRTTCTYCGVGCQLDLNVNPRTNRIVRVTSEAGCAVNDGNTCVKGRFGFQFVASPERLTTPLIREDGAFREATWEEALAYAGKRLAEVRDEHGPDGIAFLSSCRCTNEENFLMQKIARTAGRTNNVDQCATTCHAPTVAGLASAFGSGAMTNSVAEVKDVQTLFIIGSNPTEAHPIIGMEMKKALRKGAKLVVCDPRVTWMARRADVHIKHRPGTDNFLINAMMNHIIERGLHDQAFVDERCEDFEEFRENLKAYSIEEAAEVCGVDADDIRRAAEMYAEGTPSSIFYTLGITEHTCGTENVQNLANLAMLCGQIGKPSSGVNPLRGQNNVQGGCDMGAIHTVFPGYQKVADEAVRAKFGKAWGVEIPTNVGGRVTDFIEKAREGKLKAFYVLGEDPVLSEPNQAKVIESLEKLDFLLVQEIFMSETAKLADVVLPATCFAEKDGTFTNSERRVQRVRKAVQAPGQARPDWQIICDVSTAMGYPMDYEQRLGGLRRDGQPDAQLRRHVLRAHRRGRPAVALPDARPSRHAVPARGPLHARARADARHPLPPAGRGARRGVPLRPLHGPHALQLQHRQHDAQERGHRAEAGRELRRDAPRRRRTPRRERRRPGAREHAARLARGAGARRREGAPRLPLDAVPLRREFHQPAHQRRLRQRHPHRRIQVLRRAGRVRTVGGRLNAKGANDMKTVLVIDTVGGSRAALGEALDAAGFGVTTDRSAQPDAIVLAADAAGLATALAGGPRRRRAGRARGGPRSLGLGPHVRLGGGARSGRALRQPRGRTGAGPAPGGHPGRAGGRERPGRRPHGLYPRPCHHERRGIGGVLPSGCRQRARR